MKGSHSRPLVAPSDGSAFSMQDKEKARISVQTKAEPSADSVGSKPLEGLTVGIEATFQRCSPDFMPLVKKEHRILTKPSKGVSNNGLDNEEANLICRVYDVLESKSGSSYTILETLGSGTFGQVFRCQKVGTKEIVAIKVIKNKPAYHTQGLLEVKVVQTLNEKFDPKDERSIVRMEDYFEFKGHVCIIFELLSLSLLDILTQNQFRGLPLTVVQRFTRQLLSALTTLEAANIIHCDLKPENILLSQAKEVTEIVGSMGEGSVSPPPGSTSSSRHLSSIKLIDFGSACFEGKTSFSYIQSRFYRSPEVILGSPYNGSIDMWSLACVCAEMYLGLPLFPGVSQHNQLSRIVSMMGDPPDIFIEGRNGPKYYHRLLESRPVGSNKEGEQDEKALMTANESRDASVGTKGYIDGQSKYRIKTAAEYARDSGTKVPQLKKYLRYDNLEDVILKTPYATKNKLTSSQKRDEMLRRECFLDFLKGLFRSNPFERWTAKQASGHPFITGATYATPFVPEFDVKINERKLSFMLFMQRHGYSGPNLMSICRRNSRPATLETDRVDKAKATSSDLEEDTQMRKRIKEADRSEDASTSGEPNADDAHHKMEIATDKVTKAEIMSSSSHDTGKSSQESNREKPAPFNVASPHQKKNKLTSRMHSSPKGLRGISAAIHNHNNSQGGNNTMNANTNFVTSEPSASPNVPPRGLLQRGKPVNPENIGVSTGSSGRDQTTSRRGSRRGSANSVAASSLPNASTRAGFMGIPVVSHTARQQHQTHARHVPAGHAAQVGEQMKLLHHQGHYGGMYIHPSVAPTGVPINASGVNVNNYAPAVANSGQTPTSFTYAYPTSVNGQTIYAYSPLTASVGSMHPVSSLSTSPNSSSVSAATSMAHSHGSSPMSYGAYGQYMQDFGQSLVRPDIDDARMMQSGTNHIAVPGGYVMNNSTDGPMYTQQQYSLDTINGGGRGHHYPHNQQKAPIPLGYYNSAGMSYTTADGTPVDPSSIRDYQAAGHVVFASYDPRKTQPTVMYMASAAAAAPPPIPPQQGRRGSLNSSNGHGNYQGNTHNAGYVTHTGPRRRISSSDANTHGSSQGPRGETGKDSGRPSGSNAALSGTDRGSFHNGKAVPGVDFVGAARDTSDTMGNPTSGDNESEAMTTGNDEDDKESNESENEEMSAGDNTPFFAVDN